MLGLNELQKLINLPRNCSSKASGNCCVCYCSYLQLARWSPSVWEYQAEEKKHNFMLLIIVIVIILLAFCLLSLCWPDIVADSSCIKLRLEWSLEVRASCLTFYICSNDETND